MYIKVVIGDSEHAFASEVLVNPNCPLRIIYDYIQEKFNIDRDFEFDLCDENGNLVFIHEKNPWTIGTENFIEKSTYFVVFFERDEENKITNSLLYVPEFFRKSSTQLNEMILKIKKQLARMVQGGKGNRSRKTRSNSLTFTK